MTNPVFNQNGFQFYDDDGAPGSSTGQGINTDASYEADTPFQLRIEVEVTNSKAVNNQSLAMFAQRYNSGGTPQGSLFSVYDSSGPTQGLAFYDSSNLTDGAEDSTDRLTGAGTSSLTFNIGLVEDVSTGGFIGGLDPVSAGGFDFGGTDHNEIHFGLVIDSGVGSDGDYFIIELRLDTGDPLNGYSRKPRVDRASGAARRIFITHV